MSGNRLKALAHDMDAQASVDGLRASADAAGVQPQDAEIGDGFRLQLQVHGIDCTFRLVSGPDGVQRELVARFSAPGAVTLAYALAEMFGFSDGRGGRSMDLPHPRWHVVSEIAPGGRETWRIVERLTN